MVSIAKVQQGLTKFIDREVIPGLSVSERILVGTGAGLLANKIPALLQTYADHPLLKTMDVLDLQNGMVDIKAVYDAAQPYIGADPIPVTIPIVEITLKLGKREIDTLYKYIMEV